MNSNTETDNDFLFKHKIKEGYNFPKYPNHKIGNNLLIHKYKTSDINYIQNIYNSENIENEKRYYYGYFFKL